MASTLTSRARSGKLITTFTGRQIRRVLLAHHAGDLLKDMNCRIITCSNWNVTDRQACCFAKRRDEKGSRRLHLLHISCAALAPGEFEVVRFRKADFLGHLVEALCNWQTPRRERLAQGRKPRSHRTPFSTHRQEGVLVHGAH